MPSSRSVVGAGRALALAGMVLAAACAPSSGEQDTVARAAPTPSTAVTAVPPEPAPGAGAIELEAPAPPSRPPWLGTRPLPLRADGFGQVLPTPPELADRRLPTIDVLPPPEGGEFASTAGPVPADVADRSTWGPDCPVDLTDLRYLTVSHWGFDDRPHTGELLVHADVADDVVEVFRRLHEARFPIEEMRITGTDELDAHPTGDGNNTSAFVCRPSRGTTSWSEHAYGRAVDINPFHNPYLRRDVVLPELASAYVDRSGVRPGMILPGDVVTTAFAGAGWGWGGNWRTSKDYMHFSVSGR